MSQIINTQNSSEHVKILKHALHCANMKCATQRAKIRMIEEQRDSWLPWWFRQGLFKFLRRNFPATRKLLKSYVFEDYVSPDTLRQIYETKKTNKRLEKERNKREGRDNKGRKASHD